MKSKDSLIQGRVFLEFGLLSLYAMWGGYNSSAVLLAQLVLKFRNFEHFGSISVCFFVSMWNCSSVAPTIITNPFLLSHTMKSELEFCSCPPGVYH